MMHAIASAQSLLLHGPRQLAWVNDVLPELGPHDLLLHTRAGAISLGTEIPLYLGQSRSSNAPTYPLMTGYESVADVVACGTAVQTVDIGDRVVACYGHRTAAVVSESQVIPVPGDIPDMLAVLLILACDTAKGVSKVHLQPMYRVLIIGGGAIGLLTLFNLHARGMRAVDVVEPVPHRRVAALAFGAQVALDPQHEPPPANQYQLGFECSSRNDAFSLLQAAVLPDGCICILADGNLEPLTLTPAFHAKELTVIGSSDGLDYRDYASWFWTVVRQDRYPLVDLFEQSTHADGLPEVFAAIAGSAVRPLKVFVEYQHE